MDLPLTYPFIVASRLLASPWCPSHACTVGSGPSPFIEGELCEADCWRVVLEHSVGILRNVSPTIHAGAIVPMLSTSKSVPTHVVPV